MSLHLETVKANPADFLTGGGEMGERMRSRDWAESALGPVADWPQSLKTSVSTCLNSRFAILIWWGKSFIKIYNDAYAAILGRKHPDALGAPGRAVWPEIWPIIGPMLESVLERGEATWSDSLLLELERDGYPEECYFTFSYSPIRDESGGIAGIFTPVQETTSQVIGERRLRTLRDLAAAAPASNVRNADEVCLVAGEILARNQRDIPFAAFYLLSAEGREARLCCKVGFSGPTPFIPGVVHLAEESWLFAAAARKGTMEVVPLPQEPAGFPGGAWPVPPRQAVVLPITPTGQRAGFLILGVSPRKRLIEDYLSFFSLVAGHVGTAVAEAQAFEEEHRRAEALAELDCAKTTFFSNISHEFRTPLTLMLGPLEEILSMGERLDPVTRERVAVSCRNGRRLQKLVNTLLDFSRIEAGRVQAFYEPVDLAAMTAELASSFRSAMEKAGLHFIVECVSLPEPVFVDREMWEKVVLNLLSNAFKYTFEGRVVVHLEARQGRAMLSVEDTGTGIADHELPRLFERFHRVDGARGRTQEGTGIGLALVAELVRLHGGTVDVQSTLGRGSAFVVAIPFGTKHLPRERLESARTQNSTALHAESYVEEATRWLPTVVGEAGDNPSPDGSPIRAGDTLQTMWTNSSAERVLVADDNADMRDYIVRLLAGRYQVRAVANGEEALAAVLADPPDLVITDVMMPGLDGFGLLQALRSNPETSSLPVVILSARAGDEATAEGLDHGASDYLMKPFTARELLARVRAHLEMARLRKQAAQRERELLADAESERDKALGILGSIADGFLMLDRDWCFTYVNAAGERLLENTREGLIGRNFWEQFPEIRGSAAEQEIRRVSSERKPAEFEYFHDIRQRWFSIRAYPVNQDGVSVCFRDITEQRTSSEVQERLAAIVESSDDAIISKDLNGIIRSWNRGAERIFGYTTEEIIGRHISTLAAPEVVDEIPAILERIKRGERFDHYQTKRRTKAGKILTVSLTISAIHDSTGAIVGASKVARDVTEQKHAELELRRANQDLEQFAYSASHDLQEPLRAVAVFSELLSMRCRDQLDDEGLLLLNHLKSGASRTQMLIRDLLAYTQMANTDDPAPEAMIDSNAVVLAATASLAQAIDESQALLTSDQLPTLRVHPVHLQQVFQNLIGNSIKYRSELRPRIHLAARHVDREWLFSVQDNGIGIDPEYHDRIFGLFKRLHTADQYSGTGIGLAICQRIVERYRGRIWVESTPGKGATFYFSLPV